GGVDYREFLLDINQKQSQPYLSMDSLQMFIADQGNLTNAYNATARTFAGRSAAYDMDLGQLGNWVKLNSALNPGSGKGDMLVYIPDSHFAGASASSYLVVYSRFGDHFTSTSGFEEWAVHSGASGSSGGSSFAAALGSINGTVYNQVLGTDTYLAASHVVVFLDPNNNGVLDDNEQYINTDDLGHYEFSNLVVGMGAFSTYHVREIVPDGYTTDTPLVNVTLTLTSPTATVDFYNNIFAPPPSEPPPP